MSICLTEDFEQSTLNRGFKLSMIVCQVSVLELLQRKITFCIGSDLSSK